VEASEASFAIAKRRRRWLKRLGFGLLILLLLLIPLSCAWFLWHRSLQQRLDVALAELDRTDPGWRLDDIEDAREQIPIEENSAPIVVAAAKLMDRVWPPLEFEAFGQDFPHQEQIEPHVYAWLEQELDNRQLAVEEARKLADMPRGRHRLEYQWFADGMWRFDQSEVRRVVHLLTCDALRHAQRQNTRAALISCRSSLNAARSVGDAPLYESQRMRSFEVMKTCFAIARVLAQGEPPLDELSSMQHSLKSEDDFPDMLIAARGERASLDATFDAIENGDVVYSWVEGKWANWMRINYFIGFYGRDKFREAHPAMLTAMSRFVSIARLPMHEQAAAGQELYLELRSRARSEPWVVEFMPALHQFNATSRFKHTYLRCTIAALAAERYRQTHKIWPDSLESLCPQFLAAVPLDPFDGESLRYRRVEDGVIIYSVSSDGTDDDGNLDREHPNQPGVDIGVRLWDVAKRRQPPRPKEQREDPR
jgi:hypothetical protein